MVLVRKLQNNKIRVRSAGIVTRRRSNVEWIYFSFNTFGGFLLLFASQILDTYIRSQWPLKYIFNEEFLVHLFTIQICSVLQAKKACISAFRNKKQI